MSKKVLAIGFVLCVTFVMVSCKKDYQKLSTEFIQQLPDTSTLLVQVENESEHLVYYMGTSLDYIFCFNAETGRTETIEIPDVDGYDAPTSILGVGKENIMIGNYAVSNDSGLTQAFVQLYNLKTKKFKNFIACNWYDIDEGTSQISCLTYDVDRYGDGKCTTDIYDFDGNLLSKKDAEVCSLKEVPAGTLAAKRQAAEIQNVGTTYHQTSTPHYYCILCGAEYNTVRDVTSNSCPRRGIGEKHILYEGSEKEQYACRYCGAQFRTIRDMTFNSCPRRGNGEKHIPAL